jgi:hypothetical protein
MARKKIRGAKRSRPGTPEEREQAEHDLRLSVLRLQDSAYWNLRTRLANFSIFFGFIGVLFIAWGEATGARLIPTLACAVGGVMGGGVYFSRPYPLLTRWLLVSALAMTVGGLIGIGVITGRGS